MERQSLLNCSAPDESYDGDNDSTFHSQSSVELDALIPGNDDNDVGKDNSPPEFRFNDLTPEQFDPKYESSTSEFWAYCSWLIGNSSLAMCQFAPVAFQNLLKQAAGTAGILRYLGRDRNVNSIVLLSNGIAFCVEVVVFITLGSFADFGSWRPNILIAHTLLTVAIGFAWLGVHTPEQWHLAVLLYIAGIAAYTVAFTFWTAAFVSLARNLPVLRRKAEELKAGSISRAEYDRVDSMSRSKMYNIPNYVVSPFQVMILAICNIMLYRLDANESDAKSSWGISVVLAFNSALGLVFSLPWFVLEKRRPGQTPPANMNIIRAGLWQWGQTASHIWRLKQTLLYLIAFFLMGDSLSTTITVVVTLQSEVMEYDLIKLNYLNMVGWAGQFFGIYASWHLQRKYHISSKTMWVAVASTIVVLDVWGMMGIWSQKIGYHHAWEFWLFQVWWGFAVSPYYSYCQIMVSAHIPSPPLTHAPLPISEVTPRGKEFLFFSFFNIVGTTTSFTGPVISSAIIDASKTKNNSLPFYFLTAVGMASFLLVFFFVDLDKSREEQAKFLAEEKWIKGRLDEGRRSSEDRLAR